MKIFTNYILFCSTKKIKVPVWKIEKVHQRYNYPMRKHASTEMF